MAGSENTITLDAGDVVEGVGVETGSSGVAGWGSDSLGFGYVTEFTQELGIRHPHRQSCDKHDN